MPNVLAGQSIIISWNTNQIIDRKKKIKRKLQYRLPRRKIRPSLFFLNLKRENELRCMGMVPVNENINSSGLYKRRETSMLYMLARPLHKMQS